MKKLIIISHIFFIIFLTCSCGTNDYDTNTTAIFKGQSINWKVIIEESKSIVKISCYYKGTVKPDVPIAVTFNTSKDFTTTGTINYADPLNCFTAKTEKDPSKFIDYDNQIVEISYLDSLEKITLQKQ